MLVALFLQACGGPRAYQGTITPVDLSVCSLDGAFTLESTNRYFPLEVGQQWVLEGGGERVQITVLDETEVVGSVTTRVVEEREWEDGEQVEVSRNFFAQASDGTVCYFGETVVPEAGEWRADDPGNRPGIIMPGDPRPGMQFVMEVGPGEAEDMGVVMALGEPTTVPAGTFTDTIVIQEIDPLDGARENKVFAAGVGFLVDEDMELVRY